jgi:Oxidoreductase-like protein, N-terminal
VSDRLEGGSSTMAAIKRATESPLRCPRLIGTLVYRVRPGPQPSERSKSFSSLARNRSDAQQTTQAQPLSGYYADLLSTPTPTQPPRTVMTRANAAKMQTKEDRVRVVFGSRLAGSGYERRSSDTPDATWRTINGVSLPPRPAEPDNCCMSGCVHCVWDDYRDEVEGWAVRLQEAQAKAGAAVGSSGPGVSAKIGMRSNEVADASTSMDDDGGGGETNWGGGDLGELFSSIPVGIREFMRTEKRLRERHRSQQQGG